MNAHLANGITLLAVALIIAIIALVVLGYRCRLAEDGVIATTIIAALLFVLLSGMGLDALLKGL